MTGFKSSIYIGCIDRSNRCVQQGKTNQKARKERQAGVILSQQCGFSFFYFSLRNGLNRSIGQQSWQRADCQNAQPSPLPQPRSRMGVRSRCLSAIKPACGQPALPSPALQGICGIVSDVHIPCCARGAPLFRRPYRYQGASLGAWGSGCESDSRWVD